MTDLSIESVPVGSLTLLPGNPRRGDLESVKRSLEAFGQQKPIVASRDTHEVLAGNHTLLAARALGWERISVAWSDLTPGQAKAFALADNRTHDLGEYDDEALLALLVSVDDDTLLAAAGYDDDDIVALLAETSPAPVTHTDPDAVPAPSEIIRARRGDIWVLGEHRLLCGDATVPADVTKLMGADLADLVWTDPPYGVSYVGKTKDALTFENDGSATLGALLCDAIANIIQSTQRGAPVYIASPPGPLALTFGNIIHDAGLYRQTLIWAKDRFVLGHSDYHYRHELIYFGYTPGATGRRGRGGTGWYGDNAQDTLLTFPRPSASEHHPTMKPVALITHCIINSAAPHAIILDPFAGSGSTLIAAHDTGHRARLIELDPHYCDTIVTRWEQHTGQKATLA